MLSDKAKKIKMLKPGNYFRNKTLQRVLIAVVTILAAFLIVESGAVPKKYKLNIGDKSSHDIIAPRDIENRIRTEQIAREAREAVQPVMKDISGASLEVINNIDRFTTSVETERKGVERRLEEKEITRKSKEYKQQLELEQEVAFIKLSRDIKNQGIPLSEDQVRYLISKATEDEISLFKRTTKDIIYNIMLEDITVDTVLSKISLVQNTFQEKNLNQDFKNIGSILVKTVLKPNKSIDHEQTKLEKDKVYEDIVNNKKIIIKKNDRILSVGDLITIDKLEILKELNLLETASRFDFAFAGGILTMLLLLGALLLVYMKHFCRRILYDRSDMTLLCVIIIMTLLISRWIYEYSALAIPIFMAAMLISILLDLKLAIIVNFILAIAISFITKGDPYFIYLATVGGSFSAFLVAKANQRSQLSMAGLIIAFVNVVIIVCIGIINKSGFITIANNSVIVFINGIASSILTIGMLPFWESTFNIITPLKLLELTNPNQPLIKRLLMEAPGTYHHSLMVGNLAEVATEAIGGNALLARVGAYFHDIGKLKRPNFFKENQLTDNPHDRMTPNLSTLVITSHTSDGVELAAKYKIPLAVRDIIKQHHGTTLVAYFYHKAKKGEKGESVKQENFRYAGPKPSSKEAAVVMLADSVEAAVRSMLDKTEGKIEGLIRKIIKDKLDDGQLDLCSLTLRDLDIIAKAFMRVLSGLYHEREEYPEVKIKAQEFEDPRESAVAYEEAKENKDNKDNEDRAKDSEKEGSELSGAYN